MAYLRLPPLSSVRDILKLYRLSALKKLSQNFLMDTQLTDKIVKCMGKVYNSQILEVGPGPGSITRSILKKLPKKLIVVEKDKRFNPTLHLLKDVYCNTNNEMIVIFDDIMNVNTRDIFDLNQAKEWTDECPEAHVIGNLPFSISTALIIKWLHDISLKKGLWSLGRVQMTLTFQKEVAERLVAHIKEHHRCRLSVMAQTWTTPKLQFIIPGNAFVPKPDVDVGVVSFTPLVTPRTNHEFRLFEKITRHLFSFRQKYCIKSIGTLFPPDCRKQLSYVMCNLADVDPHTRPFNLTVEDIDRLTSAYKYLCEKHQEIISYDYRGSTRILSTKLIKSVTLEDLNYNKNLHVSRYF